MEKNSAPRLPTRTFSRSRCPSAVAVTVPMSKPSSRKRWGVSAWVSMISDEEWIARASCREAAWMEAGVNIAIAAGKSTRAITACLSALIFSDLPCSGADIFDRLLHSLQVRAEGDHADPDREALPQHRAGEVHPLARVHALEEFLIERIESPLVEPGRAKAKGHDRQLGLGEDLDSFRLPQLLRRPAGQLELLLQVSPERLDAVHLQRK